MTFTLFRVRFHFLLHDSAQNCQLPLALVLPALVLKLKKRLAELENRAGT